MKECDYCEASFDDDEAYTAHLAAEHENELGRIDRRRVQQAGLNQGGRTTQLTIAAGVVIVLMGVGYFVFFTGNGVDPSGIEAEPLPDRGNDTLLRNVTTYDNLSRNHVETGATIEYPFEPPVGGRHWPATEVRDAGFYEETQPYEALVHNLEHGHVVIYYDENALSDDAENSLREFAAAHTGDFTSVVVVPNPKDDPKSSFVLTAWGHRLRMSDYNPRIVRAFLAEYLGRGPEGEGR